MATALDNEEKPNCAICIQIYTEPRQLPGCSHSFCENCIVKLILDLKQNEKLGSEFECPVCKLPSSSPGPEDSVHRWVTTLKVNEDIKARCAEEIKTEDVPDVSKCCSHCLSCEKTVSANKFCWSCQKYYCGSCSEALHAFAVNQGHTVIDCFENGDTGKFEDDLQLLNKFVTCSEHPKEFVTFYCQDEKKFCCVTCSVDFHKSCKYVKPIANFSEQSSIPTLSANILDLTDKLLKHIDSVIKAVKGNNDDNKTKAEQLGVKFEEMKQKVIKLLDTMESNLNDERKAAVKNAAVKNQDEIDNLEYLKQKLKTVPRLLEQVEKFTSVDQALVCVLEIEHSVEDIEKKIIEKGGMVKTFGLELNTTDIFETIQNLGPNETAKLASVTQPEACIVVPVYEDRPFLRNCKIEKTGAYKVKFKTDKTNTPTFGGLLFLPQNKFLLVDSFHGFLYIVDERFDISKQWVNFYRKTDPDNSFSNERHAVYFESGVIVLSLNSYGRLLLLSADGSFTNKGEIFCEYQPKAICGLRSGDIAIAWNNPVAFGIISSSTWNTCGRVYSMNGALQYCEKIYFTKDTSGRQLQSFQYMAVDEARGHIIQPCSVEKAVFCFDFDGKPIFRYSHNVLKDPKGVAVDTEGNVYICEFSFNCIHIVSPDGIGITIIGKGQGCPFRPLAIAYNKNNNVFAVTEDGDDKGWDRVTFFTVKKLK